MMSVDVLYLRYNRDFVGSVGSGITTFVRLIDMKIQKIYM